MKYMLWSDLEPGDVLQFTDEYLSCCSDYSNKKYKNKDLIIHDIEFHPNDIYIYFSPNFSQVISYNGTSIYYKISKILMFKLIKLKDE